MKDTESNRKNALKEYADFKGYGPGDTVMIRIVANVFIGQIVAKSPFEYHLAPAVWVRDVGENMHTHALKTGELRMVQPIPEKSLPLSIANAPKLDIARWNHKIPHEATPQR